jgi:signal recognition particle GTPase
MQSRARDKARQTYDDLDALAGTWSAQQARQFEQAMSPFSEVDPALWK